jgi:hypothetical protein
VPTIGAACIPSAEATRTPADIASLQGRSST